MFSNLNTSSTLNQGFGGGTGTTPSTFGGAQGSSLFGTTPTGGGAFSTGANTSSIFGTTQPSTSSSLLFGGSAYNNQQKSTFGSAFGSPQQQPPQTASVFGQQARPSTNLFGTSTPTVGVSPFSTTNVTLGNQISGTTVPFAPITGNDTMMKNGITSPINTRHQCITCMKEYDNKSLEELRLEDYQQNRKGSVQAGSLFGQQQQQTASTGLFSNVQNPTATVSAFGQPTQPSFGQTAASTAGGGLFSNLSQSKSFFGNNTSAPSAFGGSTGTTFGGFGAPAGTPGSGLFGQPSTTQAPGLTNTSSFGFGQQQQPQQAQSSFGLFSQNKPLQTTATSTPGFGFGTTTNTNTLTLGNTSTSNTSTFDTPTASAFGQPAASTSGGFGFGATPQQPQAQKPFSFGNAFGTNTSTGFGSSGGTTAFTFSNPTTTLSFGAPTTFGTNTTSSGFGFGQQQPTSSGFSFGQTNTNPTSFGSNSFSFNPPSSTSGFNFSNTNPLTQPTVQQNTNQGPNFAYSPYKDSPLFYNFLANRDVEDIFKATSPLAQRATQEASRRKASQSLNSSRIISSVKNLTFPVSKGSFYKGFNGFTEIDYGTDVDILSPKNSIKKLHVKGIPGLSRVSLSNSSPSSFNHSFNGRDHNEYNDSSVEEYSIGFDATTGKNGGEFRARQLNFADSYCANDTFNNNQEDQRVNGNANNNHGDETVNGDYTSANGERKSGVVNSRPGYYLKPSIEELDDLTDENGNCFVKGFIIGRHNYGEIRFCEIVNVAGLNFDELVMFRHKEVILYPDESKKPVVGEGINCSAEISLMRVWPIDKTDKNPIKDPIKIRSLNYVEKLKRSCARLNCTFISYNEETGIWTFKVNHF